MLVFTCIQHPTNWHLGILASWIVRARAVNLASADASATSACDASGCPNKTAGPSTRCGPTFDHAFARSSAANRKIRPYMNMFVRTSEDLIDLSSARQTSSMNNRPDLSLLH